jgi:hypothetical protein
MSYPCARIWSVRKIHAAWGGAVDEPRVKDEFERMKLHRDREKAQDFISQYERGLAHYRKQVVDFSYEIGKRDERLGGES